VSGHFKLKYARGLGRAGQRSAPIAVSLSLDQRLVDGFGGLDAPLVLFKLGDVVQGTLGLAWHSFCRGRLVEEFAGLPEGGAEKMKYALVIWHGEE
jgi:hypothetical protein